MNHNYGALMSLRKSLAFGRQLGSHRWLHPRRREKPLPYWGSRRQIGQPRT